MLINYYCDTRLPRLKPNEMSVAWLMNQICPRVVIRLD